MNDLAALDAQFRVPTCQHCLADPRHTPLGDARKPRCPVCGSAYSGPRRDAEYQVLLDAGLVAVEPPEVKA
jgi:hypothetical protein